MTNKGLWIILGQSTTDVISILEQNRIKRLEAVLNSHKKHKKKFIR